MADLKSPCSAPSGKWSRRDLLRLAVSVCPGRWTRESDWSYSPSENESE